MYKIIVTAIAILFLSSNLFSQDPNFHIYLCFGQSNMEGQGKIEIQDKTVDPRFNVMQAVNCSNLGRSKESWYPAVPPLTRCWSGLSPADYFGRTMVENLPDSIRVGIINVSIAGCKIELFDKDNYKTYVTGVESWMANIIKEYGGNPYAHLVQLATLAQQDDGLIKGILLHQGESNTGDNQWPTKVKGVYDNLIADLNLDPSAVPLLVGEVVHADQGGVCASMNNIIAKLPQTLPNSYVISSSKCTDAADNLHFDSEGYRKLGKRYAVQMLSLQGIEAKDTEAPEEPKGSEGTESVYFEAECTTLGTNWEILTDTEASNESYVSVTPGIQSLTEAAGESEGILSVPFEVSTDSTYYVYALLDCPTADDDSFWVKMDNGTYTMANGLATNGWQWMTLGEYELSKGEHQLSFTYREDGAKMDKICISNYSELPSGLDEEAYNICVPDTSTLGVFFMDANNTFALGQNFPNPFKGLTNISFEIPRETFVSLKVYNTLGMELSELAGKVYPKGIHTAEFECTNLAKGIYFYTLKADRFFASKKMIVKGR